MSPEIPPLEEILHSPKIEGVSTARELVRKYLGSSIGNESNTNGLSVDSTDVLYKDQIYPFVIALVPAYNEELRVTETLRSLINQTRPPDVIIVIADNCTDGTAALALAMGVNVVETSKNTDMKAGALNSVIDKILPMLDETDSILVMDADTILSPNFIRSALRALFAPLPKGKKPVGGVGGIFLALPEKWSLASQLQTNEYLRYQRRLGRRRGRALVLTGTGSMFNIRTLRAVVEGRKSGRFPNLGGGVQCMTLQLLLKITS
jgi:cellulose synthase/poly-beta-1,6-N-acetylglucosamine synthase-like glycosyltransferase